MRFRANLLLFLAGTACLGSVGGIFDTTFNNYLNDTFNITASTRGFLEFPRELPGFLTALFIGMLFFLSETRIAAVSSLTVGLGMIGLAFCGGNWTMMLVCMTLWSMGTHLMLPVRSSIAMDLGRAGSKGARLGQVASVSTAASIAGCVVVWVAMKLRPGDYRLTFIIGGCVAMSAAVAQFLMRMPNAHLQRPKFIWCNAYWLYYILAFLFGARKQIFLTFAPWVLVKIFNQPAHVFALLLIAASVLGIAFQPVLGRAIDRCGERAVLMADSICIAAICIGYGCAHMVGNRGLALGLLYACFIADQLLFGVNMARDTYLSKIALKAAHVSPTLSLGVSINHIVSMSIPAIGGLMWMKYGHASVFFASAGVAALMLVFSSMIRIPHAGQQRA